MTLIPDEVFLSPAEINLHPCMSSSRWLNVVPESVIITQVCQDSNNTSLVIFNITLVGVFLFTPTLKILSVDDNSSYEENNIVAPFALGHFRNPMLPINTACNTYHGQLVFDVGSVIPEYRSAQTIVFKLIMAGQTPQSFGVNFPNQTATYNYQWNKGVLPSPVGLTYYQGSIGVTFQYEGNVDCSCNIQCFIPTGVSKNVIFCPGEKQTVYLYQDPNSTDPYSILVQLSDSLGNISDLNLQAVFNTVPKAPVVSTSVKPKRVNITIFRQSENDIEINDDVQIRVMKFEGSPSNQSVWKDWSGIGWNTFVDFAVLPGERYGYALQFKGKFGDISTISSWTEITI